MNVVDSLTDLIRGNPFETEVGSLILKATSDNDGINFDRFLLISQLINQTKDGPKEAFLAIKRRLKNTIQTSPNAALSTLTLWEVCLDNCGYRFQMLYSERDSLSDIVKYSMPSGDLYTSPAIHQKILAIFKKYGEKFVDNVDIQSFSSYYTELLNAGAYSAYDDMHVETVDYNQIPSHEIGRIKHVLTNMPIHHQLSTRRNVAGQVDDDERLSASYARRMKLDDDPLTRTRKENFREMALSKVELLMNLIEANKDQKLEEIDSDVRNLMMELNSNLNGIQHTLVHSIQQIQMRSETSNTSSAMEVNTKLDSELMTLIGLNDEVLNCSKLFQEKFLLSSNKNGFKLDELEKLSNVINNNNSSQKLPEIPSSSGPGIKDSISELKEMQQWLNDHDKLQANNNSNLSTTIMKSTPVLEKNVSFSEKSGGELEMTPAPGFSHQLSLLALAESSSNDEGENESDLANPSMIALPSHSESSKKNPLYPSFIINNEPKDATVGQSQDDDVTEKILSEFDPFAVSKR